MKITRKFSVVLLIMALAVSCFAISAFAEGATMTSYKDVLEYYESETYLEESFDGVDSANEAFAKVSESLSVVGSLSTMSIAPLEGGKALTSSNLGPVIFKATEASAPVGMGINARISFNASFALIVYDETGAPLTVFKVDDKIKATSGNVEYSEDNAVEVYPNAESRVTVSNALYSIGAYFKNGEAGVSGTINLKSTDGAVSETYNFSVADYKVSSVAFVYNAGNEGVITDYLQIYEGSYARSFVEKDEIVGQCIKGIMTLYKAEIAKAAPDKAYAKDLLSTVDRLVAFHGYSPEALTDSALKEQVADAIDACYGYYAADSLASFKASVGLINTNAAYPQRVLAADGAYASVKTIEYILANYPTLVPAGNLAADIQLVKDEMAALENLENETIAVIEEVKKIGDPLISSYGELKAVYDVISELEFCPTYVNDSLGYSAEDMVGITEKVNTTISRFETVEDSLVRFVENVALASNTGKTFLTRYYAYLRAERYYFYDETFTPDGFADMNEVLEAYDYAATYVENKSSIADPFITNINNADATESYAVRVEALAAASYYLEKVEMTYPGVEEAYNKYLTLTKACEDQVAATESYIKAVLAIGRATTDAEKNAAIEIARVYSVLGSDVSVNVTVDGVTVAQANVIFSDADIHLQVFEAVNNNFINAVNNIAKAKTLAERRAAIHEAIYRRDIEGVDDTVAGIAEAKVTLDAAIEKYNSDIEVSNSAAVATTNVATAVTSGTAPTSIVGAIVAIIKKIFE